LTVFKAFSVVGYHGVGKTRLVVSMIKELTRRGYRVGTVKHIPEKHFTIDRAGKDTWAHAKAGAELVVSLAPGEVAKIEKRSARLEEILKSLSGVDFVIVEGFKSFSGLAKVVVAQSEAEAKELVDELTIACVGLKWSSVPSFNFKQVKEITDLVEERTFPPLFDLDCKQCGFVSCREFALAVVSGRRRWEDCPVLTGSVVLKVDGRQVPLNQFAQGLLAGVVGGMVAALSSPGREVEIKVVNVDR
jgi:molybdopterin-guanine dinucleotide biosynthesis protein B